MLTGDSPGGIKEERKDINMLQEESKLEKLSDCSAEVP